MTLQHPLLVLPILLCARQSPPKTFRASRSIQSLAALLTAAHEAAASHESSGGDCLRK